ncbi:hypothetical protein ACP70R_036407 [Stipagrostis hirtigluma subsp. patula]
MPPVQSLTRTTPPRKRPSSTSLDAVGPFAGTGGARGPGAVRAVQSGEPRGGACGGPVAAAARAGAPVTVAGASGTPVGGAAAARLPARVVPRRVPRRGNGRAPRRPPLRPPPSWPPRASHHHHTLLIDLLPDGVIYQFAPLDCPDAIDSFIRHWKPSLVLLMESELWPNLIMSAAEKGIAVALLNARMSSKSFHRWSAHLGLPLVSLMLSKLSLIAPLSTVQAVRFQLLHAPPGIIHFAGDLKYAVGDVDAGEIEVNKIKDLQQQFSNRPLWMAASIHRGEEAVILRVHDELIKVYPTLLLILVPRHPQDSKIFSAALKKRKISFVLRSNKEVVSSNIRIYIVDTLGELRMFYRVAPVAVIGGSFLPGLAGHNISEAAAAGCAVITGPHVGHFYHMLVEMWQISPLAAKQVAGEFELLEALKELLGDSKDLKACQRAAKDAFSIMSAGVVNLTLERGKNALVDNRHR